MPPKILRKKPVALVTTIVLLIASLGVNGFLIYQLSKRQNISTVQQPQQTEDKTLLTLNAVSKLMELPDEKPTVATVSDPEKLKEQIFFANAQLDDVVLLYMAAKKAILYRPSINKIIEVAPINSAPEREPTSDAVAPADTESE